MAQDAGFESPYKFKGDGVTVVLKHHLDKNLRVKPNSGDDLDGEGGFGEWARWVVNISQDGGNTIATFKNVKTGDYLRIVKDGGINAGGKGHKLCKFKVHRISNFVFTFESVEHEGSFIAVNKDKNVVVGKGGPLCRFNVLKEGAAPPFSNAYMFKKENTVVIEHRDLTTLRVKPNDTGNVDSEGGHGDFAQWTATPSDDGKVVAFKSKKTGECLRIKKDGGVDAQGKPDGPWTFFKVHRVDAVNEVRLESQKFDGKFIELDPKNKTFVAGDGKGKTAVFTILREN